MCLHRYQALIQHVAGLGSMERRGRGLGTLREPNPVCQHDPVLQAGIMTQLTGSHPTIHKSLQDS